MHSETARYSQLRFVFDDAVLSFDIAADATFGEIARALDGVSMLRHGHPIAIDVTLGPAGAIRAVRRLEPAQRLETAR